MVRGDEVQEVQTDILRGGFESFPIFEREFSPERIHDLDADRNVAEQFATEFARNSKTRLRGAHFPKFAAIVEKHSGEKEVAVEHGIGRANGIGGAHHLARVPEQTASVGVVVVAGGGGALEAGSEILRTQLKQEGLLTRDPRMKERKKPGRPGARKRFQFSKR